MKRLACVLVLMALVAGGAVFAADVTTSMDVSAELQSSATVSTTSLDFGTWSIGDGDLEAEATITVTATTATGYGITLGNGSYYADSSRNVANGAARIAYDIYSDDLKTALWIGVTAVTGTGDGTAQTHTAYGTLHNAAVPGTATGSYTDTVVVTVTY